MESARTKPENLVADGILTKRNIYRTAKVSLKRKDLCIARTKDNFKDITIGTINDTIGTISDCDQSLAENDYLSVDQWRGLTTWHCGLSCMLSLPSKPLQTMMIDDEDSDFYNDFKAAKSSVKDPVTKDRFQQFLVYELRRGTAVPPDVGIEQDGDNHICLYPSARPFTVSQVSSGHDEFVVNALEILAPQWRSFALLKIKASGYTWPENFPPDTSQFPIRQWVECVVVTAPADLAVAVGESTEEFVEGRRTWPDYFRSLVCVAQRFGLVCDYEGALLNIEMLTSLRFALAVSELGGGQYSFVIKSSTVTDPAQEQILAATRSEEIISVLRATLGVQQGATRVAAAASIDVIFVASVVEGSRDYPQLPIAVNLPDDKTLLFDKIDTHPVFEGAEADLENRAATVVHTVPVPCAAEEKESGHRVVVDLDASVGIEVLLSEEVVGQVQRECSSCFGYTQRGTKCKNLRRAGQDSSRPVWCHHHALQEVEFSQFLESGRRPDCCAWWDDYDNEALVLSGRKLSL